MPDFEYYKELPFADRQNKTTPQFNERVHFTLQKNGAPVTLLTGHEAQCFPEPLLQVAWHEMNYVIEEGKTYPHYQSMTYPEFQAYMFEGFAAILVDGVYDESWKDAEAGFWAEKYLGHFYVKPNYVGRCSHVCNAGFVVNHVRRGLGLGKELGRQFLAIAPKLGYASSVFNLVFESNVASCRIWDSLGFEKIGYIKDVAVLKGQDSLVGAYLYGYNFLQKGT